MGHNNQVSLSTKMWLSSDYIQTKPLVLKNRMDKQLGIKISLLQYWNKSPFRLQLQQNKRYRNNPFIINGGAKYPAKF